MGNGILIVGLLGAGLAASAQAQVVFGPAVKTPLAGTTAPIFAACDLDGDGFDDLVVGRAGTPGLRLSDGAGHFGAESPLPTDAEGETVAVADMNGDDVPDLLVGSSHTASLSVSLGDGAGGYPSSFDYALGGATLINKLSLDVRDGDGDGDLDVLAVTPGQQFGTALGEARLFRNLGDGHLGLVAVLPTWSVGSKIARGRLGDLNGDRLPDLVLLFDSGFNFEAQALLCQPDATFVTSWQATGVIPERLGDLDGDGDLDLLVDASSVSNPPVGGLTAMLNAGDGSFTVGPTTAIDSPSGLVVNELADLDEDGVLDLALTMPLPPELRLLRGAGDGSFLEASAHVSLYPTGYQAGAGTLGDFDGDGRTDLVVGISPMAVPASLVCTLNRTYAAGGPLLDLGHQLQGTSWPILIAAGSFVPTQSFSFSLSGAPASGSAFFIVGLSQLNAPFKGGTMVPLPSLVSGPWPASPGGDVSIAGLWPAGPSGLELVFQFWIPDAAGPAGFASSSGLAVNLP